MKILKRHAIILVLVFVTHSFVNAQLCNIKNGFVGNTFNGANDKWVQNYSEELDVSSDGTMVTTSTWDESGRCIGVWKDGQPVTLLKQSDPNDGCWGWGTGTEAAAIDDDYLYAVNCSNNLLRWNRKVRYRYVDKTNMGETTDMVAGMTYSDGYLYLIKKSGLVEKRSVENLGAVSLSFTVTGGYDLAVDKFGDIWVITTSKEVLKYDASGINTGIKTITQAGWSPTAVNYDAFNNLLLVSDNGPRRQVIKFNTSGSQVGIFGDEGGISGGTPGLVGDLRFWNIAGCGTDSIGNIYVALNEKSTSLRKFNPGGVKQWEVQGMFFVDMVSIDPASDGVDMYGVNEHIKYDYSANTWSLHAITCDAIANPSDPRITTDGTSSLMRRVNGNLLMFVSNMYAGHFDVYRFVGEIAVFCQTFECPGWTGLPDKNGNIWYVNSPTIRKIPLTGFINGVPVFGPEVVVSQSIPEPITVVERLEYDSDNDVMYIGGWTATDGNNLGDWGLIGSTIARYPNWSTDNRIASHTIVPPKDVEGYCLKAMSVAGDYVFIAGSRDVGKVYVFNAKDLSMEGYIPTPTDMGSTGWLDVPHAVQAFKKSNGQYLILVEEDYRGKNLLYQWCPTGDCTASDQKYPDLIPSEFEIINENNEVVTELVPKEKIRFRIKVTNQGTGSVPAGKNFADGKSFKVKFSIKNLDTGVTKLLLTDTCTLELASGKSLQLVSYSPTNPFEWIVEKGKFSITTQVNPMLGSNISECDRTNNSLIFTTDSYDTLHVETGPVDKNVIMGGEVTFSVEVMGYEPITYQWFINDVEQQNLNSNQLLISDASTDLNDAKIKVIATNTLGSITSNVATLTVIDPYGASRPGYLLKQGWYNIGGTAISDLEGIAHFPNNPDSISFINKFEITSNVGDSYGVRVSGWIIAPETGDYTFYIASDDNGQLKLSTDSLPQNLRPVPIALVPEWSDPRQFGKYPQQTSVPVYLEAGKKYYVEAMFKEGSGGDNLCVAWKMPGGLTETPIPSSSLAFYTKNTTGIESDLAKSLNLVTVYPSPSSNFINIRTSLNSPQIEFIISDIVGRVVKTGRLNENENINFRINVSELNSGIYVLSVRDHKNKVNTKFVINRN